MSLGAPNWLWGLAGIPVLALLFVYAEHRTARRLQDFVAPRLLLRLTASVDRFRRSIRFALQLISLALAFVALAQPRWGYSFEETKRKGIDLLIAVDTSRSMLSNDVQPNRLERVKLAAQDLISDLQGDRVGVIAFAGRAFLQAPLTIDYDAAVEAINDLDTKTIPEGGTNISEAINLASQTYGKSAVGNRALVIFTDGEELTGDAVKTAKSAADAGIRIFTVGVGTPQGSLIPLAGNDGGTAFVKDDKGQVVKSKLDENRLREISQTTGGFYLHLENGPRTMQQLFDGGLSTMTAKEMDVRLSRQPIERYQWPLSASVLTLAASVLLGERKRRRLRAPGRIAPTITPAPVVATIFLLSANSMFGSIAGLNFYEDGKYADAYAAFQDDLKNHPDSPDKDKIQFDAGAAAYKMRDYNKAAEAFSQALLTKEKSLQENSHYNMGRTLEERADMARTDQDALVDLENALSHYQDVLKLNPNNPGAKANVEEVKKKIERLKRKRKEKPTPPPQQQKKQDKKQQQSQDQDQQNQSGQNEQSSSGKDQQQSGQQNQNQQKQSQANNQSGAGKDQQQQPQNNRDQSQAKNEHQPKQQNNSSGGSSPSPSPQNQAGGSPSPSPGQAEKGKKEADKSGNGNEAPGPTASPGDGQSDADASPSPGEGEGSGQGATPSATPATSPQKKFAGEIKGAQEGESPPPGETPPAVAELDREGEMTERQARALLESMKNEEARVQLDERRAQRRVYNDW